MTEAQLRDVLNTLIAEIKAYQENNHDSVQESLSVLEKRNEVLTTQFDLIKDESAAQKQDKSFSEAFQSEAFRGEVKRLVSGPGFQYSNKSRLKKVGNFNEFKLLCEQALAEIKGRIEALKSAALAAAASAAAAAVDVSSVSDLPQAAAVSAGGSVLETAVSKTSISSEGSSNAAHAADTATTSAQTVTNATSATGTDASSADATTASSDELAAAASPNGLSTPAARRKKDDKPVTPESNAAASDAPVPVAVPQLPETDDIVLAYEQAGRLDRWRTYLSAVIEFIELCAKFNPGKIEKFETKKIIKEVREAYKNLDIKRFSGRQQQLGANLNMSDTVDRLYLYSEYQAVERAAAAYESACLDCLQKAKALDLKAKLNVDSVKKAYDEFTAVSEVALPLLVQYPSCAARKSDIDSLNQQFNQYLEGGNAVEEKVAQDKAAGGDDLNKLILSLEYRAFNHAVKVYENFCLAFLQKAKKGFVLKKQLNLNDLKTAYSEFTKVIDALPPALGEQYPSCAEQKTKMKNVNTELQAYGAARNAFKSGAEKRRRGTLSI